MKHLLPAVLILALLIMAAFCFAAGSTGWITAGAIATAYALWGAVMWRKHHKELERRNTGNDHDNGRR